MAPKHSRKFGGWGGMVGVEKRDFKDYFAAIKKRNVGTFVPKNKISLKCFEN
jgi:hypothetical protein